MSWFILAKYTLAKSKIPKNVFWGAQHLKMYAQGSYRKLVILFWREQLENFKYPQTYHLSLQLRRWKARTKQVPDYIRKFLENPWNTWIWWRIPSRPTKSQILTFFGKEWQKISCKTFHRTKYFLNFFDLSATFCPRLSDEKEFHS